MSYAAPIHDGTGAIVAAIHASVLANRATKAHERSLLTAVKDCAAPIEKQLGNLADKANK